MKTSFIKRIAAVILLLAPPAAAQPQVRTTSGGTFIAAPFPKAIESDGVLLRFLGWHAYSTGQDSNGDLHVHRTLDISFNVIDPTGRKPFRIVHPTRITKFIDGAGKDISDWFRTSDPTDLSALNGPVVSFVEASRNPYEGAVTSRPAVFSLVRGDALPGTVAEMSGIVSVCVPIGPVEHTTPLAQSDDWKDVGPGVSVRIDSLGLPREDMCLVSGTLKLRGEVENDPAANTPALLSISVLETDAGPPQAQSALLHDRFQIRPIATENGSLFTFSFSLGGKMKVAEMAARRSLVVSVSQSTKVITLPFTFRNLPITDAPKVSTIPTPSPSP